MTIETNLEKASKSTRVVSENREEVTATTKLVGWRPADIGKIGEDNCMCIAVGASTSQEISAQARGKECQKRREAEPLPFRAL
jgi:hypothetical protein